MMFTFVTGSPNSGTSAVTGILHHLGLNIGEPHDRPGPYSTFEDRKVDTEINEDFRYPWDFAKSGAIPDHHAYCLSLHTQFASRHFPAQHAAKSGGLLWGLHAATFPLPLRVIITQRTAPQVVASWKRHHGKPSFETLRWLYTIMAVRDSLTLPYSPLIHIVHFDNLIERPHVEVRAIARFLSIPADPAPAIEFIRQGCRSQKTK